VQARCKAERVKVAAESNGNPAAAETRGRQNQNAAYEAENGGRYRTRQQARRCVCRQERERRRQLAGEPAQGRQAAERIENARRQVCFY